MSVVVVESGSDETPSEEAAEEVAEAVETMAESIDDAQSHAIDINHAERITRLEDAFTTFSASTTAALEEISSRIASLTFHEELQDERIEQVADETTEVAEGAADAIETVAEETETASEEITKDEMPATRTHPFFRRWGKGK